MVVQEGAEEQREVVEVFVGEIDVFIALPSVVCSAPVTPELPDPFNSLAWLSTVNFYRNQSTSVAVNYYFCNCVFLFW